MLVKLQLDYAEFYITNSCNFNCSGCNRFNNYNFAGTQIWHDYADMYAKWSKIVDIKCWTILGGEPMMNPSYPLWLENIHHLWPNSQGSFLTNGHFLQADNKPLYDVIRRSQGNIRLNIGLHNINRRQSVLDSVRSWLVGSIVVKRTPENLRQLPGFDQNWKQSYNTVRDSSWPDCDTIDDWPVLPDHVRQECQEVHGLSPELLADTRKGWLLTDTNGVTVQIDHADYFHQNVLRPDTNGKLGLHASDPVKAHDLCDMKTCHHFIRGKLYKCGVVGVLPDLDQQFDLNITEQDRKLLHSYQAATPDMNWLDLQNFINDLNNPIAQCKFCPEKYEIKQIFAEHGKKIKLAKNTKEPNGKQEKNCDIGYMVGGGHVRH